MTPTWMYNATCRGQNPDWWHPPDGQSGLAHRGIKICQTCPVKQQCLDYALSFTPVEDTHGIYGGYTVKQRRAIRDGKPIPTIKPGPARQTITGLDDQEQQ